MNIFNNRKGAVLIGVFVILVVLTAIAAAFITMISFEAKNTGAEFNDAKALHLAEAGLAKARWALTSGAQAVGWGESDIALGAGTYTVTTTDNGDSTYTIIAEGYVPNDTNPLGRRRVEERNISVSISALTNLCLGATATASSSRGANVPGRAIDGSLSTWWQANGNPSPSHPQWLRVDLGSAKTFNRVVFTEPPGNTITAYTIQYSSNGSSWSNVSNPVASKVGTVTTVNFTAVTVRYHRIRITASALTRPSISEYESYDTNQAVSVTLGQGKFVTTW
jgi:hypothetical protein